MLRMFAKPNPSFRRKTFMFPQTNNLQEWDPLSEHAQDISEL